MIRPLARCCCRRLPGVPAAAFNAGPVFADYYAPASQLVTANYDSNTITIINTSLDQFGNDSPLFGQAVTVPVGNGPATLTILRDGSRVYVPIRRTAR